MNIAIVSVFDVSLLEQYVYPQYRARIKQLDSNFTPAVSTLVLELLRKGETIIVFTQDVKAEKVEEFHGDNVHVYVAPRVPKLKRYLSCGLSTISQLKKLFPLHKQPIDVVSAHWTREYAIASGYFFDKVPVFVTIRDIMPKIMASAKSDRLRWRLVWLMNEYVLRKKGYRYLANSDYTAHAVKHYWGHSIPVIPNPVAMPDIKPEMLDNDARTLKEIVITTVSLSDFPNKWKNIPTLLEAFAIFRKEYPQAVLNLVGPYFIEENPLVEAYRRGAIMEGVKLLGRRSPQEITGILAHSSIMVHPSFEETFGNTLIEALAIATPVVGGSKSGAVPWVLQHGKIGYLCDVSSPKDIADTMSHVVEHYDEAKAKGLLGQQECKSTYSASNVADEYLKLFDNSL